MKLFNATTVPTNQKGRKTKRPEMSIGHTGKFTLNQEAVTLLQISDPTKIAFAVEEKSLYLYLDESGYEFNKVKANGTDRAYFCFHNNRLREEIYGAIGYEGKSSQFGFKPEQMPLTLPSGKVKAYELHLLTV